MKYLFIIVPLIVCGCSFPKHEKEYDVISNGDSSYFVNSKDTINLGMNCFEKDLFLGLNTELFPNIQNEKQFPEQIGVYDEIEGIYINSRLFDHFELEHSRINKKDNDFDILFIYPEISRYNFQFSEILSYRIFDYSGFLYQEPSARQNLPYYVQNISIINNNQLLITYIDKSSYMSDKNKIDTLIFSTYPHIKFEFSDKDLMSLQQSTEYIKLSEEVLEEMNFSIPANSLPQDVTELYLTEVVTRLVNLKFDTKFKTNEIIETLN
jgi:hypothetical protein